MVAVSTMSSRSVGVGARHCAEHLEVEGASDDRCRGQGAMHVGAQTSDPLADDVADALRERQLVEVARQRVAARGVLCDGTRLGQVAQQLGDEERIAVRLPAQRVGERHAGLVHLVAGRSLYQFEDLVVSQATEVDPVHRRLAVQIGQQHARADGPAPDHWAGRSPRSGTPCARRSRRGDEGARGSRNRPTAGRRGR